ncbi:terminase large subunit [Freshwater phage uvFW-CGR-AMD-COM-C403]|nr:terminase large subunit [Freshwater phage uvFW-CGR-AMD-COM-C403]
MERNLTPEEARKELIDLVRQGRTIADALKVIGRSRSWYDTQRREAQGFAAFIDNARFRTADLAEDARTNLSDFAEFSEKYLGAKVWDHMLNVVDMLEGREPRWIDPAMTYEKGSGGLSRLLVNVPPNHAKTMTITINYVTYRIVKNPNISVIVISKTQEQAKKFLYAIKQRLTHPRYADLQAAFGPADGYKATADQWSANKIYLGGDIRDNDAKDPTVEAIGMGGQVYGARADLIVLDDVVTLSNANEWAKQQEWIRQEVASRLPPGGGQLLVVGTRVSAVDLYKELRNPQHYTDGILPWSYLSMPAVLEYADNPKDWKTLWAKSEQPLTDTDVPDENGYFDRWTGERLTAVRNEAGPSKWSLVYQNLDIAENAIFDPMCVRGAVNGMRKSGALIAGAAGHPDNAQNFYRIIGIDPAMSGDTAAVAYAVDRRTHKRYVMDVHVMSSPTPAAIRSLIKEWTDAYKPHTVIVESNAFQLFLTQDEEIRNFLATRGINYRPHYTGNNKQDPEFGVASLAPLFGTVTKRDGNNNNLKHAGDNIIELPDSSRNEHIKKLVEQLVTWQPGVQGKRLKMDAVMALWFCEIVARDVLLTSANVPSFLKNEFTPRHEIESRYIVNLDDLAAAQRIVRL